MLEALPAMLEWARATRLSAGQLDLFSAAPLEPPVEEDLQEVPESGSHIEDSPGRDIYENSGKKRMLARPSPRPSRWRRWSQRSKNRAICARVCSPQPRSTSNMWARAYRWWVFSARYAPWKAHPVKASRLLMAGSKMPTAVSRWWHFLPTTNTIASCGPAATR